MKLLLDLTPLDAPTRHRGPGRYLRELALGLAELPAGTLGDVELVALTHLDLGGSYRVTNDIASFTGSPEIPSPSPRDHYRWAYARRIALWRAARGTGARAVHLGDPNATPLLMGLTSCKRIVTCHDAIPSRYPARYFGPRDGGPFIGRAIERRRYRDADVVVAISDATRDDARALLGVPADKIVRVYNGTDVARWSAEPALDRGAVLAARGLADRAFALYVGGLHWHKNIEGMLGGLARARRDLPHLELAWAGRLSDEQRGEVERLARGAGVRGALRWLGFVADDELAVLYRAAAAHLLVSHCEGFGLTVIEAMAAGCPVVTTAGGSLAEVAGDAALTVPADDHDAIGIALVRAALDGELRAELVARGRARAPSFSREVQARAMASVYRASLESAPR